VSNSAPEASLLIALERGADPREPGRK
jgi:hypothetical protein